MPKVIKILLTICAVYLLIISLLYFFQERFIFQPVALDQCHLFSFDQSFEEFFLEEDSKNLKVNALFFPADSSKGLILYLHGNADNLQRWGKYAKDFTQHHYDFLGIDYPGYGKSGGEPSEQKCYESADLAYHWAREHYPEKQIIIYGRSLGTGSAAWLASRYPAKHLMLETPFPSIPHLFNDRLPIFFPIKHVFPVEDYIQSVKYPITIFQGTEDLIVPYNAAIQLKKHLHDKDQFITIPGGKHKNLNTYKTYSSNLASLLSL